MTESVPDSGDANKPPASHRAAMEGIPDQLSQRRELLELVGRYVRRNRLVPPLSLNELDEHCRKVLAEAGSPQEWRDFVAVLINNEVWRDILAGVPFEKRLLLMPRCLRPVDRCPARMDSLGLLCQECGGCDIGKLKAEAARLGYVVLVAEGVPVVVELVASGKIEAILGVSCLDSLERIFPCIETAAVPGIAIPLLQDGCRDTQVDFDWVWEILHLRSDSNANRSNMESMRILVDSWFAAAQLESVLGTPGNRTESIAQEWLARSGKRWRPFLAVCSYMSLCPQGAAEGPPGLRKIALAVECFHKASLIHDDIEDNDAIRYGQKTLHEQYGTPIALNVGDFLIGEGYRLIGETDADPVAKEQMLRAAAIGHRSLCVGQGQELLWMRQPAPLSVPEVLEIFRHKTAPAFEVALRLGAIYAGAGQEVWDALAAFSDALGIAYQIRDDLDDFAGTGDHDDAKAMRPSLLLAIAYQNARGSQKEILDQAWRRGLGDDQALARLRRVMEELQARQAATAMLQEYRERALEALRLLKDPTLKGLLRRVMGKIFGELESARQTA